MFTRKIKHDNSATIEEPDVMWQYVAFHKGLCHLIQYIYPRTYTIIDLEMITYHDLIYRMNHSKFIVINQLVYFIIIQIVIIRQNEAKQLDLLRF